MWRAIAPDRYMLDGMVACVQSHIKTGELYNEVPAYFGRGCFHRSGFAWGGTWRSVMSRPFSILHRLCSCRGQNAGAPNEFCGPMAKQHSHAGHHVNLQYSHHATILADDDVR